jgi:hypothetical protein
MKRTKIDFQRNEVIIEIFGMLSVDLAISPRRSAASPQVLAIPPQCLAIPPEDAEQPPSVQEHAPGILAVPPEGLAIAPEDLAVSPNKKNASFDQILALPLKKYVKNQKTKNPFLSQEGISVVLFYD